MKIALCYIVVTRGRITADYCARFVASYMAFPPTVEHSTYVICNGGPLSQELGLMFLPLHPHFFPRENDAGYDISAYIDAANGPCRDFDMMLCLGESIRFHRRGWLRRLQDAWEKHGPGMYGSFSSNLVRPHLNTTGFVCPPSVLSKYPGQVNSKASRYEFEHGRKSFWRFVASRGMPVHLVTWDGEWNPRAWRCPHNILWRGNQENCLMFCGHTDRFAEADARTKTRWSRGADQPFT